MRAALAALLVVSGVALAAPEEDVLGKAEGYPSCGRDIRPRRSASSTCSATTTSCSKRVSVPRGPDVRALPRAATEPAIRYASAGQPSTRSTISWRATAPPDS